MIKKKYNDDLFEYLNWILKKPVKNLTVQNTPSIFITNRWLSMLDVHTANIVNVSFNRWIVCKNFNSDPLLAGKFYRTLTAKNTKRINYIKKGTSETVKETEEDQCVAKNMEISSREVEMYNQTLEFLKK